MQNTATIPMESLLAMLSGMSLNDRRWLAEQLTEQIEREATETAKSWNDFLAKGSLWEDDSNERLDAALACFHKDWGGDKDPEEDLILVTGNIKHFDRVPGLKVENWMVEG